MTIRVESTDLLSIQQTAKKLNMPRTTLYRWGERGKILTIRLGGILFVPKSEIERIKKEKVTAWSGR